MVLSEKTPLVLNGNQSADQPTSAAAAGNHHAKKRVLRVLPLIALLFFNVSGGEVRQTLLTMIC